MKNYVDYFDKPLYLNDKVLFANNSQLLKGFVKQIFGNIIVLTGENGYRYDFSYHGVKDGIIKLEEHE